jgi:hypothetical protein
MILLALRIKKLRGTNNFTPLCPSNVWVPINRSFHSSLSDLLF